MGILDTLPGCAQRWAHRGPFIAAPWALLSTLEQSQLPSSSSPPPSPSPPIRPSAAAAPILALLRWRRKRTAAAAHRRSNLVKRSNKKVESSAPLLSGLPSAAGRPAGRLGPGPLGLHGCQGRRTGDGTRTMTSLGSGRTKEDADGGAWRRKWQIRYSGRSSKRELRFIMRWIARVEKKGRGS